MNVSNKYMRLIKSLPLERCPEGFTEKIVQASGIASNPGKNRYARTASFFYGAACIITLCLLLAAVNLGISNGGSSSRDMLARNIIIVGEQISLGFKTAFYM